MMYKKILIILNFIFLGSLFACDDPSIIISSYDPKYSNRGLTISMEITLKNNGSNNCSATDVVATLTSSSSYIDVTNPTQSYGSISAEQTVSKNFSIDVSGSAPYDKFDLNLSITYSGGSANYTIPFVVSTLLRTISAEAYWKPNKVIRHNSRIYVDGYNFIKSFDISDPTNPSNEGSTESFVYQCGDSTMVGYDIGHFPQDNVLVYSTKCKGVRAYDMDTNPKNPPCKGFINFNNIRAVGVVKVQNKRYVLMGTSGPFYYADLTDLPGNCEDAVSHSLLDGINRNVEDIITFTYNNKPYVALTSKVYGFELYDFSNFPSSITKICSTSDKSLSAEYFNGKIFINSVNGGLKVYNIPNCTLDSSYNNYNYSQAISEGADYNYAYVSMGACMYTNKGFEIIDYKNSTKATYWNYIYPCLGEIDFDVEPLEGSNGNVYLYRIAGTGIYIYPLQMSEEFANIVLNSYSPTNVDPGKSYALTIILKNTGNISATNVVGNLTKGYDPNNYIQINTSQQDYGTINGGSTQSKSFNITVSSNAQESTVQLILNVSTSNAGSYSFPIDININPPSPILNRTFTKVADAIRVTYTNSGNADYNGSFNLTLNSYTKGLTFDPSTQEFSNIPQGQSKYNDYPIVLGQYCTPLYFVSLVAEEDPHVSEAPQLEELNVSFDGGTYPFVKRESSSLSKNQNDGKYYLSLTLKNIIIGTTANNVSATVSADRTEVSWEQNNQNYGNISSSSITKSFIFTIPEGTTGDINFIVEITSNEGCWTYTFTHNLADIKFEYKDYKNCGCGIRCTNDHNDIHEGVADAPACIDFNFKLKNIGTSTAQNISVYLKEYQENPNVEIVDEEAKYTLAPGEENFSLSGDKFSVRIYDGFCSDSSCPKLKLTLYNESYGFSQTLEFTVNPSDDEPPPQNTCNLSVKGGSLQITADSNSDGNANPGEKVDFTIEIQNTGDAEAPNVQGTISLPSGKEDYVTLDIDKVNFGTIPASQSKRNTTPFRFTLSSEAPTGNYNFPITISSSCSSTNFSGTITITVYSSSGGDIVLSYVGYNVSGSSDPNYLEKGKSQSLWVKLKNESSTALSSSQGILTENEEGVEVLSQGKYPSISPGKIAQASFEVSVDSNFNSSSILFHIEVENAVVSNPDFTVNVLTSPPSSTPQAMSIPIATSAKGANNTNWKTDLFLQNPSAQTQNLTMKLLKAGETNEEPPQVQISLLPNSSLTIKDILDNQSYPEFKVERGGFLIEFDGEVPPFVSGRIYNDQGESGTYGQFTPGIPIPNKSRGTSGDNPVYLVGMVKNEKFRANMGLTNVSPSWNEIKISFYNIYGLSIGKELTYNLAPYNLLQLDNILSEAEAPNYNGPFLVKAESITKADFIAWGSIIDNRTGDASFINDQIGNYKNTLIMGVAHKKGANNTNWKTDLFIYNPSSSDLEFVVYYRPYGEETIFGAKVGPVDKGGVLIIEDILSKIPGLTEEEAGFLLVYPDGNVDENPIISARTYNDLEEDGTYGQFIPGLDIDNGYAVQGQKLVLSGVTINDSFRSNLGVFNADPVNKNTILITLLSNDGNTVSSFYQELGPRMGLQINYNELLSRFGFKSDFKFEGYTIVVEGTVNTFAYISIVDNKSSDPVFMLPALR